MIEMIDYKSLDVVIELLETVQTNEKDERNSARECTNFVHKANGQWEDRVYQDWNGRPRYTFDRVTPIIDMIVGEMESNEFYATVDSMSGEEDEKVEELLDGMLRAIQNASDASFIYKRVARKLTTCGFDAVQIKHDYPDADCFDQELFIEYIPNAIDRVWFDPNSELQDRSDAEYCFVLHALTKAAYKEKFPKGNQSSVGTSRDYDTYNNGKREVIIVGQVFYKKYESKKMYLMSNGKVIDESQANIIDELLALGVTIEKERERKVPVVHTRFFGGDEWLTDEKKTAFAILPIVPFYHGFEIVEDKITWRRIVEKLIDPQRVLNYAKSRQIEEGALAPRAKIVMTREQAKGHESDLRKLNTSPNPVMFYTHVEGQPMPSMSIPGAQINQSLMMVAQDAAGDIEAISGMYAASLAKNPQVQSGIAVELQQNKGDTGNSSFYVDLAKGITAICRVLVDTIPRVYDSTRKIKAMYEDGSSEFVMINEPVLDQQSGQYVMVNDLGKGKYAVTCSMGPMFRNRAQKSQEAMLALYQVLPAAAETTSDIFTQTIDAPGMKSISERLRAQLLAAGAIPFDQMTKQEQEAELVKQQEAMQSQGPDPLAELAQAQLDLEAAKIELDAASKEAEIEYKKAQARKTQAEAEAQEIENDLVETGMAEVLGIGQAQ